MKNLNRENEIYKDLPVIEFVDPIIELRKKALSDFLLTVLLVMVIILCFKFMSWYYATAIENFIYE